MSDVRGPGWVLAYSVWTDSASSYTNGHRCLAARVGGEDERYLTDAFQSHSAWWAGAVCARELKTPENGTFLGFCESVQLSQI